MANTSTEEIELAKLLIIDDDRACGTALARLFRLEGYEVQWAADSAEALAMHEEFCPDLLICDWLLGDGMFGFEVANELCSRWPTLRVIFITGLPQDQLGRQAEELPVLAIFRKPVSLDELLAAIKNAVNPRYLNTAAIGFRSAI